MWASNGDAISLEYAGTSALKGDFTRSGFRICRSSHTRQAHAECRTGKRDLRGMLNDATNSVARLVQNTISDFFKVSAVVFTRRHSSVLQADSGSTYSKL